METLKDHKVNEIPTAKQLRANVAKLKEFTLFRLSKKAVDKFDVLTAVTAVTVVNTKKINWVDTQTNKVETADVYSFIAVTKSRDTITVSNFDEILCGLLRDNCLQAIDNKNEVLFSVEVTEGKNNVRYAKAYNAQPYEEA